MISMVGGIQEDGHSKVSLFFIQDNVLGDSYLGTPLIAELFPHQAKSVSNQDHANAKRVKTRRWMNEGMCGWTLTSRGYAALEAQAPNVDLHAVCPFWAGLCRLAVVVDFPLVSYTSPVPLCTSRSAAS